MPSAPATRPRGVRRGAWDVNIGLTGIPGCGKSTVGVYTMLELARQTPCYLLAHDPEHALPRRLPDGRHVPIVRHATAEAAAAAIERSPGGIHAVACVDAGEVVAIGNRIGERSLAAAKGGPAPPVLVFIDEVTNCREMAPRSLGPTLQEAVTLRRHRHCGLIWGVQSPHLVHYQFLGKTTELLVFRLESQRDIDRLIGDAGFPQNSAAQIRTLKRFQFLRHRRRGFDVGE